MDEPVSGYAPQGIPMSAISLQPGILPPGMGPFKSPGLMLPNTIWRRRRPLSLQDLEEAGEKQCMGREGLCIVNHPDEPSLTLTDLALGDALVQLTIQTPVEYEAKYAVAFPLMLKVGQHFSQAGEVLQSVRWELDHTGKEAPWSC